MNSIKHILRKSVNITIKSVMFFFIISGSAYAESLFLKDGSISEGSIVTETDKVLKFKFADGIVKEIPRIDILRVLHHTDYNQKRYIYKTDTSLVEAYIVEEDKVSYTYRIDLNSAEEFKMMKSEIETISKKKIEFASDKKEYIPTREENISTRASRFRLGAGLGVSKPEWASDKSPFSLNLDIFLYRSRNTSGNGFDFFGRGFYGVIKHSSGGVGDVHPASFANDYFGIDIPSTFTIRDIKLEQVSLGAGIRYIHGFYLGGVLWQGYLMGYYHYSMFGLDIEGDDTGTYQVTYSYDANSSGITGGAGIEIALASYFGIFAEYTNGYTIAFGHNAEIKIVQAGVTLRTSFL